jgi:hypothetical protein
VQIWEIDIRINFLSYRTCDCRMGPINLLQVTLADLLNTKTFVFPVGGGGGGPSRCLAFFKTAILYYINPLVVMKVF